MIDLHYYVDNYKKLTFNEYTEALKLVRSIITRVQTKDSIRDELASIRITTHEEQLALYEDLDMYKITEPIDLTGDELLLLKTFHLYSQKGTFLLNHRFLIDVHDASGNLLTFIGWYPDKRKYITIPSRYFSKQIDWFNVDSALPLSYNYFNRTIFVVEGIFDALSLRAVGFPVIATMGANVNLIKSKFLNLFDHVILIPDGDEVGNNSLRYWNAPTGSTRVKIDLHLPIQAENPDTGESFVKTLSIKDPDDLVTYVEVSGVRDILTQLMSSRQLLEVIH